MLYRLKCGEDVTVGSLLDILRVMGFNIRLERLGMPTLANVQQRFAQDDDDDAS